MLRQPLRSLASSLCGALQPNFRSHCYRDVYCCHVQIAFLVLSHRQPAQLIRLLTTLRAQLPDAPIVVHHDCYREDLSESAIEHIGNIYLLKASKPTAWGDFSIVDAYLRSLRWMIEHIQFDWVVMLSAQDYPIKPLSGLENYLTKKAADAVLSATPINSVPTATAKRDLRRRYLYQYRPARIDLSRRHVLRETRRKLRRATGRLVDAANAVQPFFKLYRLPDGMPYRFGWRARTTPFGRGPCWHGSMWFSLSLRTVEFILTYMGDHPDYIAYYRRTIIPDESVICTLLCNDPRLRVDNRDVQYTRWTHPGTGHPDIFTSEDLPELIAVDEFFARKFDIDKDVEVLKKLDKINLRSNYDPA